VTDLQNGSPKWGVRLSQDASHAFRTAALPVRHALTACIDRLTGEGVPGNASPVPGRAAWRFKDTGSELTVVVDEGRRTILVVAIRVDTPPPVRDALRLVRVPAALASRASEFIAEVTSDVRLALRSYRRSPGLAVSVIMTLALAIGGTTALFGLMTTVTSGAMPFRESHRLLRLRDNTVTPAGVERLFNQAPLNFLAIRDRNRVFESVVGQGGFNLVLTGGESPQRLNGIRVADGWAATLGLRAALGRVFTPDEEELGADANVAILSSALWQSRFGADPAVVGSEVSFDGGRFTVVGVLGSGFAYPYDADLWMPGRWDATDGNSHDLNVVARLLPGVTLEAAQADLDRIAREVADERPDTNARIGFRAATVRADFVREEDRILTALLVAVGFLLLLACLNVTNLLVARFVSREREIGIRSALGASRLRQLRQSTTETMVLFVVGGGVGLLLALWLGNALNVLVPDAMRNELDMPGLKLDATVVGFALLVSVGAGLVFGLFAASRGSRVNVAGVLREGARGGNRRSIGMQRVLVVAELTLSLVLLVGAGLMFDHFQRLRTRDLGIVTEDLYTTRLSLEGTRYAEAEARAAVTEALHDAIAAVPGVERVGMTTVNPFCCGNWGAPLDVEGRESATDEAAVLVHHRLVDADYFLATGTPLVSGRVFGSEDRLGTGLSVVVDESMARRFWPGEDPLGKRIRVARPDEPWHTVVGVVRDVEEEGDYTDTWYLAYAQTPVGRSSENLHFMIRAKDAGVMSQVRQAVLSVDPTLPTYETASMTDVRSVNLSQDRLGATMATVFACFGALLAALGLFGVLSYFVNTRWREIGTRIALGATRGDVVRMILREAMAMSIIAIPFGVAVGLGLNRVLQSIVPGIEPAGILLLLTVTAVLVSVTFLSALGPTLRAVRIEPAVAFRD